MAKVKGLKHVSAWFCKKTEKWRAYYKAPGQKQVPLPITKDGLLRTTAVLDTVAAIQEGRPLPLAAQAIGASRTRSGSLDAAIVALYEHASFTQLGDHSKKRHRQVLEKFRQEETEDEGGKRATRGQRQVDEFTSEALAAILEDVSSAHTQRHLMNALRALMAFCKMTGRIETNPTLEVKAKRAPKTGGFPPWEEEHVTAYRAHWALGTMQRLALEVILNTGLRKCDAVRLGRPHLKAGRHVITPSKTKNSTGMVVKIAVHSDLQAALDAMPPRTVKPGSTTALTYLVSAQGKPFTPENFGKWFSEACEAAGLPVRAHGLRKLICIRLVHRGMKPHAIGAILGDTDLKSILIYTAEFDRQVESDKSMRALEQAVV